MTSTDTLDAAPPLTAEEFRRLWFDEWHFSLSGKPEDACLYLWGVLRQIKDGPSISNTLETIGGIEGLQQFVFAWLWSVDLIDCERKLTQKGELVLLSLDEDVYLDVFLPVSNEDKC